MQMFNRQNQRESKYRKQISGYSFIYIRVFRYIYVNNNIKERRVSTDIYQNFSKNLNMENEVNSSTEK